MTDATTTNAGPGMLAALRNRGGSGTFVEPFDSRGEGRCHPTIFEFLDAAGAE